MGSDTSQQSSDLAGQLENLRTGIHDVAHEINNRLGTIRMAIYFLQTTNPAAEKREHYFKVIEEGLERMEHNLHFLKKLRENPSAGVHEQPSENQ